MGDNTWAMFVINNLFFLVENISFLALAAILMVLFAMIGSTSIKIQLLLELSEGGLANL